MWIALLLATLSRFGCIDAPPAIPLLQVVRADREVTNDPAVLRTCWDMVVSAHFGFSRIEHAAFVVRSASGSLSLVSWETSGQPDCARWDGPFPNGTVAIVHTHPNWLPLPSGIDVRTAARTRVPVYVLTSGRISKTNGVSIEIVASGEWRPKT